MAFYVEIAEEKLNSVLKTKEKIQLNHAQCDFLCQMLKKTVSNARSGLAANRDGVYDKVLRELLFAIERAEVVVEKCCNENLLQAAISQIDVTMEFSALVSFIELCDSLLVPNLAGHIRALESYMFHVNDNTRRESESREGDLNRSLQEDSESLESEESNLKGILNCVKSYVNNDITNKQSEGRDSDFKFFLQKLEEFKEKEEISGSESDLAGYMLKRYKPSLTASGPTQSKDFTWKVESTEMKTGRRLGTGGSGLTYETTWLGEKFARKYFPGTSYPAFDEEAAVLIGLQHLNIVHTFCWSIDKRSCSIILELVVDDLDSFLQRSKELRIRNMADTPFDLLEAVHTMLQIATGMAYLEKNGVAHEDLKPSNILVNPVTVSEGGRINAKLVDFGLTETKKWSSKFSHQTQNMESSVRWKAPELFSPADLCGTSTNVDDDSDDEMVAYSPIDLSKLKVADVYNFGLTCSQILTGEVPYSDSTLADSRLADMRTRILSGELRPTLPPPPKCPKRLEDLIQRCWGTSTKDRPNFSTICKELKLLQVSAMTGTIS